MKLLINKAENKDIPAIIRIHKNCVLKTNARVYSPEVIKEWVKQVSAKNVKDQWNNSSWYVLKSDNKIIGFAQSSLGNKELYQIQINPVFQGKGSGKILYDFIEKQFKKNKIKTISLNSTLNAFPFYKKLGFKLLKKIKFKLDKSDIEMIKMRKTI